MGAPPADKAQPFLREEALERIGDDAGFLDELLALYDQEFASKIAALERALAEGDMNAARDLGHNLKGASANLSLPGLQAAALDMEMAADPEGARAALERLRNEYARLKTFLG